MWHSVVDINMRYDSCVVRKLLPVIDPNVTAGHHSRSSMHLERSAEYTSLKVNIQNILPKYIRRISLGTVVSFANLNIIVGWLRRWLSSNLWGPYYKPLSGMAQVERVKIATPPRLTKLQFVFLLVTVVVAGTCPGPFLVLFPPTAARRLSSST